MSPPVNACFVLLLFLAGSFAKGSASDRHPPCGAAVRIVKDLIQEHDQAVRDHNIDKAASLYDTQVIRMPEGFPTIIGSKNLKATMVWINKVKAVTVKLDQVACLETGRLVIVRKTSRIIGMGGNVMFDGKTLQIWRAAIGGGYRIYLEMYNNSSDPAKDTTRDGRNGLPLLNFIPE